MKSFTCNRPAICFSTGWPPHSQENWKLSPLGALWVCEWLGVSLIQRVPGTPQQCLWAGIRERLWEMQQVQTQDAEAPEWRGFSERYRKCPHRLMQMPLWVQEAQLGMQETEHKVWDAQPGRQRCGWDTDDADMLEMASTLSTTWSGDWQDGSASEDAWHQAQRSEFHLRRCKVDN